MSVPTGNEALTLTLMTNLATALQAAKDAADFAVSSGQLPAQGAPILASMVQAYIDASASSVSAIAEAVSVLTEAANQE